MSPTASHDLRKSGRSANEILAKVSAQEKELRQREFLSPYTSDSKFAVVKMVGTNYKFRIIGSTGSGFGIFQPVDPTCARFVREADATQSQSYLALLPKAYFILVCPTDLGWCAFPFNVSAAKAQLGVEQEIIVRNVSDVERFDVVVARYDGMRFWYEEPFAGADPVKASDLRGCYENRQNVTTMQRKIRKISGLTPEDRKSLDLALSAWQQIQTVSVEGRIRETLAIGGAELEGHVIRGRNIEISWQAQSGVAHNSLIDAKTFDVVSAGICLNDEDRKFHLKDLPGIIKAGEDRGAIYRTRGVYRGIDIDD